MESDVYTRPDDLDEYQRLAAFTAIYPAEWRIIYPLLGLVNEAGEVAGKIKKILRDEGYDGTLTAEQEDAIAAEMGDVQWYLAALATDLGFSLSDIANDNLSKLYSRKERGVLGGSGDNR